MGSKISLVVAVSITTHLPRLISIIETFSSMPRHALAPFDAAVLDGADLARAAVKCESA